MNLLAKIGLLSLLAGATATVVHGDPSGGWLSPNGTSGGSLAAGAAGTAVVGGAVTVTSPLSLVEAQERVRLLHEQTRADARHIQHLQQIARKEKDVIKLNCVNDKLVQVKPEMNIADTAELELESAHDADRMTVFDSISQAAETVRRLREEADQCIGQPITSGGDTSNSFSGPGMRDDPTKGFDQTEIEPPGYASPFN